MRVGRALNYAAEAFAQVMGRQAMESVEYPVNESGRIEAGFGADEVRHAAELRRTGRAARGRGGAPTG